MYWGQALGSSTVAAGFAYLGHTRYGLDLVTAVAGGAVVYVLLRTLLATLFRTRYWLRRGTRGAYWQRCGDCGQQVHRVSGDWILTCHRCGWTVGRPLVRWVRYSVPARQFQRSISWSRLLVVVVAAAAVGIAPAIGSVPATDAAAGSSPEVTDTVSTTSTVTATPAIGDQYDGDPALAAVEDEVIERTNTIRSSRGLPELSERDELNEMAQHHSNDMARDRFYSHGSTNGDSVSDRFDEFAPQCRSGSENIHMGRTESDMRVYESSEIVNTRTVDGMARYLVQGWMNSPGHRENMLDPQWRSVGVGVAVLPNGQFYATINFC